MSETPGQYISSRFDHVAKELGWVINAPEFADKVNRAFIKLAFANEPVVLRFIDSRDHGNAKYETTDYDEASQGKYLSLGSYYHEQEPKGYVMGFPVLTKLENRERMLGIEICGDPNDIYNSNAVFLMKDVVRLGVAPREQVDCLYRLENELAEGVSDEMTRFVHPDPILLDRKTGDKVYRPMTTDEREAMRLSLPLSYDYIRPRFDN